LGADRVCRCRAKGARAAPAYIAALICSKCKNIDETATSLTPRKISRAHLTRASAIFARHELMRNAMQARAGRSQKNCAPTGQIERFDRASDSQNAQIGVQVIRNGAREAALLRVAAEYFCPARVSFRAAKIRRNFGARYCSRAADLQLRLRAIRRAAS
jgi:hypothetical protein